MRVMQSQLKRFNEFERESSTAGVIIDDLRLARSRTFYERRVKRPFDLLAGLLLFVLALPVILLIATVIRLGLGKGVLYSQTRVGLAGREFVIWKFRTMRPDRRRGATSDPIDHDRRTSHKVESDPRHTGLGRLLRKTSVDELPQLINVLRGDMSLVGPRPELVEVARDRGYLDHVRHEVRPGMTGPYQVSELRLNGDLRDGLALDEDYVATLSLRNDLRYMLQTVRVMLGGSSGR